MNEDFKNTFPKEWTPQQVSDFKRDNKKAVDDHDALNAKLESLKRSNPTEFERVRLLPYAEQLEKVK